MILQSESNQYLTAKRASRLGGAGWIRCDRGLAGQPWFWNQGFWLQVLGVGRRFSGIGLRVVSLFGVCAAGFGFGLSISGFGLRVLVLFGFLDSGFGFGLRGLGLGFRGVVLLLKF